MVKIRLRALIAEDVLEMVRAKRAAILPLRIAKAIPFANGNPTIAADRLPRPSVELLEPRDYQRHFRLELAMRDVVIRQRDVEWILPRDECNWNVIPARARLRVVRAAVIRCPIEVHELLKLGTGLFPLACSPTQKTVVTIFIFHGYRWTAGRELVGIRTCGSTLINACSRSFIAYLAKSPAVA